MKLDERRGNMAALILKAHFDGKNITLDEPYDLLPGTPVIVTVFPSPSQAEEVDWNQLSSQGLARAYAPDEPEYTLGDIKP
jgi:hypothetical protein